MPPKNTNNPSDMKISDAWYGRILSLPGIILVFILIIVPVAFLVGLAFLRYNFVMPVKFVGFKNFASIFSDRLLVHALKTTAIYSAGVTGLSMIFATTIHFI